MASSYSPGRGSIPTEKTKKEERIERNKAQMGSLLIRKSEGLRGVSSGSIVRVKSEHYPKCEWCLLTSVSPAGEIQVNGYEVEFWNSKLSKSKRLKLEKIAQPTQCFRSKDGLVLIPLESRVFGDRRTFPTVYYNIEDSDEVKLHCYVMGTGMNSLAGEPFTLMGQSKRDNKGHPIKDGKGKMQYDYELHADDGIVRKTFNDFGAHLFPRGGVILKGEGLQATCVGVLNFSSEGLISPVFFTRKTLTCEVQLYYPTVGCPEGRTEVDASLALQLENRDEGSQNDDFTLYPYDRTLQAWEKLYGELNKECTRLKQQSEQDYQEISSLKNLNTDLSIKVKNIGEEKEVLRAKKEELCTKMDNLCTEIEGLRTENEELRTEKIQLIKTWRTKIEQLRLENKEMRKMWDAESNESVEARKEWHESSKQWRETINGLRRENDELRAENDELHAKLKEWPDKLKEVLDQKDSAMEMFGDETSSSEQNREMRTEVGELEVLRREYEKLCVENQELRAENDELKKLPDQLKELLYQNTNAVAASGDNTSSGEGSKDAKAEGLPGPSASNKQGGSDDSCKETPYPDSMSKVVPDLG